MCDYVGRMEREYARVRDGWKTQHVEAMVHNLSCEDVERMSNRKKKINEFLIEMLFL